jgi:transposase InsO family protein
MIGMISPTHDEEGEFLGQEFQERLRDHNIASKPTTSEEPMGNAVCERMHQTVGDTLRVLSTMDSHWVPSMLDEW